MLKYMTGNCKTRASRFDVFVCKNVESEKQQISVVIN